MGTWHPILAAVEVEPGFWHVTAQSGPYAVVRLLEVGGERGYRATTYSEPRQLVGYFTNLRAACSAAHSNYIRSHGPDSWTVGYPSYLTPDGIRTPPP